MLKDKKKKASWWYLCVCVGDRWEAFQFIHYNTHTERTTNACAPQTHKKRKHLFLFLLLPCFFFPFFLFPILVVRRPLVSFLSLYLHIPPLSWQQTMSSSAQTRTVRLTVIAADGLVKKDLFFKLPDPFGMHWQRQLLYSNRAKCVIDSCCYRGWRANSYDHCHEKDTEPLLERELWPVMWHTQPRYVHTWHADK